MNLAFILLPIIIQSIFGQVCEICENLVQEFNVGLQKSEKSNFGGGNTAWEEKKLGNFATSETRLIHIIENLCPSTINNREKCQYLREEVEEKIEDWWFKVYKVDQSSVSLHEYLCVDHLKVCCNPNYYGKSCNLCLNYNETSRSFCSGHGKCDGNGTRSGNGTCICFDGYTGDSCNECSFNYYPTVSNSVKSCTSCHNSCAGCNGNGSENCESCAAGWELIEDKCADINECLVNTTICSQNQYCSNTPGSFKCEQCDESCENCTSAGPDNCLTCRTGYQVINNQCEDINECSADSELCRDIGQKCKNLPGSFSCDCEDEFVKKPDGSCERSKKISSSTPSSSGKKIPDKSKQKSSKNRKQPKKIWTRKFEREFFKLICSILLLGLTSYFFGYYSFVVLFTGIACGYYIYHKSIKLDQIFSKSVII